MIMKKLFWQLAVLFGIVILFASPLTTTLQTVGMRMGVKVPGVVVEVKAEEIYSMFTCPCCGKILNKEEICCGSMSQMIDFIDQKIDTGATKDLVILATAQEFGLDRLANQSDQDKLRQSLIANAPSNAPKLAVAENKIDMGKVSQRDGIATTEFVIKNEGKSNLIIDKLSSSCGCTSGSVVYQGEEGPKFSMPGHGNKEPDPAWQVAIAPGDEAKVKVYYDPSVHPDLTGPVTRTVSIISNDPVDFEAKLTINLEQVK